VQKLGAELPGATELPAAAKLLPDQGRVPLGIRLRLGSVLGVHAPAPAAVGYYQQGEQRWRLLAVATRSKDEAQDLLSALGATPGATKEKAIGKGAVRVVVQEPPGAPQAEWLLAARASLVIGIGDETTVLRDGMPPEQRTKRALGTDEKRKRLKEWLTEDEPAKQEPAKPSQPRAKH